MWAWCQPSPKTPGFESVVPSSNPVKGGANPGIHPGNLRSWQGPKYVLNGPKLYIPIATRRDWVTSHTTLFQAEWRAQCQNTLPVAGQFCRWFFLQLGLVPYQRSSTTTTCLCLNGKADTRLQKKRRTELPTSVWFINGLTHTHLENREK